MASSLVKYVGKLLECWDMISLVNPLMQVLLNESQVESKESASGNDPNRVQRGERLKLQAHISRYIGLIRQWVLLDFDSIDRWLDTEREDEKRHGEGYQCQCQTLPSNSTHSFTVGGDLV